MSNKQVISTSHLKISENGIHEMTINTLDKWVGFQVDRWCDYDDNPENKFSMYFFNYLGECTSIEHIYAFDGYNPDDFFIASYQEKDQITLIFIPIEVVIEARKKEEG
jgi:hypothetical protein